MNDEQAGCDPFENGYTDAAVRKYYKAEILRLREENARLREALDRIEDDILFHIEDYRQPNNEALMMWRRDACDALGKTGLRAAIREGDKNG